MVTPSTPAAPLFLATCGYVVLRLSLLNIRSIKLLVSMRCFLSAPFAFTVFDIIDRRCSSYEVKRISTDWLFAPSLHSHYRNFLTTMGSADFSQFVVTTANETACETFLA